MKLTKTLLLIATMAITLGSFGCSNFNLMDELNGTEILVPSLSLDSLFTSSALMVSRATSIDGTETPHLYDLSILTGENYDFNFALAAFSPFTRGFETQTVSEADTTVPVKANNGNHYAFGREKNGNNGNHFHYGWANAKGNGRENHITVEVEVTDKIRITEDVTFDILNIDNIPSPIDSDNTLYVNKISSFEVISGTLDGNSFEIYFETKSYFYNPETSSDPLDIEPITVTSTSGTIVKTSNSYTINIFTMTDFDDITEAMAGDLELNEYIYTLDPNDITSPSIGFPTLTYPGSLIPIRSATYYTDGTYDFS